VKVVFRVDATIQMGIGHLMRSLSLAKSLQDHGVQVHFICREHPGNLIGILQREHIPVSILPAPTSITIPTDVDYTNWLGVTQTEDATQTIDAIINGKPDWLVVDHYGIDINWENIVRPHVKKVLVIDDLANRQHNCDVLLDQNFSSEGERRYSDLVPKTCKLLLGPHYALLKPEYAAYRRKLRKRDGQIRNVLLFFGGSDLQNMTGKALEALSCPELKHLNVNIVIGTNNIHRASIEQQVIKRPKTNIYDPRPHLADLIAKADLAIGAGGASTWERMCLGLPTVVITLAENQLPATKALVEAKLIYYAGHFTEVDDCHLKLLIQKLINNPIELADLASRNFLQVDGLGLFRVVEVLNPSPANELRLRPARKEDMLHFFNWVNDPAVRKNSFNTSVISWETHQKWYEKKLHDSNCWQFVLDAGSLPVGQIRFERCGNEAQIDYSIDKIVRGRGWGSLLVAMGVELMQKIEPIRIYANVKADNLASSAVFLKNHFLEKSSKLGMGYRQFYCNPVGSDGSK